MLDTIRFLTWPSILWKTKSCSRTFQEIIIEVIQKSEHELVPSALPSTVKGLGKWMIINKGSWYAKEKEYLIW